MTPGAPESLRDLAAGYALGVLEADEARAFEEALAQWPELQREVAEYRETSALLALRPGAAPGPELRARLLERVRTGKAVPLRPAAPPARAPVPLWIALAASAVLAVALGIRARDLDRRLGALRGELRARDSALALREAKLAARDATLGSILAAERELGVVQLTTAGPQAPGVQLFWNRTEHKAVLYAFRLRSAPAGRVYQLWLIKNGQPIPSQTFNSGPNGDALVDAFPVPAEGGFSAAAITEEPAGGSRQPTTPILLIGQIRTG